MKKIIIPVFTVIIITICVAFFSCGREDIEPTPTIPIPVDTTKVGLKLQVNKSSVNLFELVSLELLAQGAGSTFLDYDSIIWIIGDFYRHRSNAPQYMVSKKLSFSRNDDCDIYVFGYKGGIMTQSDTVNIVAQQKGDFLSVSWNNIGLPDSFYPYASEKENYHLDLFYNRRSTQHALLSYKVIAADNVAETRAQYLLSRAVLSGYITSLYGASTHIYPGNDITQTDLLDEYNERFLTHLIGADLQNPDFEFVPVEIWETATSHIALIGTIYTGEDEGYTYFKVIAEPKR